MKIIKVTAVSKEKANYLRKIFDREGSFAGDVSITEIIVDFDKSKYLQRKFKE